MEVMPHTGIPFMVEIREASSGTSLNIPKYSVMKDCTTFPPSASRASKFANNALYSGWSHALQICLAISSI